jgi:prepilin-type N-terminal cleavage/methylation domain-containing protein
MTDVKTRRPRISPGFSLLEMLVVLAVMAILSAVGLSGVQGIRNWTAVNQTHGLFGELENACRLYRLDHGGWPEAFMAGEVELNGPGTAWREALAPYMETQVLEVALTDGFGNDGLHLLLDVDGDHWIRRSEFRALAGELRPERVWANVVLYSLDGNGDIVVKSW